MYLSISHQLQNLWNFGCSVQLLKQETFSITTDTASSISLLFCPALLWLAQLIYTQACLGFPYALLIKDNSIQISPFLLVTKDSQLKFYQDCHLTCTGTLNSCQIKAIWCIYNSSLSSVACLTSATVSKKCPPACLTIFLFVFFFQNDTYFLISVHKTYCRFAIAILPDLDFHSHQCSSVKMHDLMSDHLLVGSC